MRQLRNGVIRESDMVADFFELTCGLHPARRDNVEITLFISDFTNITGDSGVEFPLGGRRFSGAPHTFPVPEVQGPEAI